MVDGCSLQVYAGSIKSFKMALTKKDLSQIKGVVHGEVENLARIVARGFEAVDKRFELVDKRFEQIDKRFELVDKRFEQIDKRFEQIDKRFEQIDDKLLHIDARLNTIEHDIDEIRRHFVYRDEFEDALARLTVVEKKLGVRR